MAPTTRSPEPRGPQADDQFVVRDLATLKAFADPLRIRFLLEFTYGPRTVKEVAKALGVGPTRLYYHLRILQKHKLVRVARRRMVSGIEERTYEATAKGWTVDSALLGPDIARTGIVKSMFDVTAAELELVLDHDPEAWGEDTTAIPMLVFTRLMLAPDEVAEVRERLSAVMRDFASDEPTLPGKTEYHAVLAAYRLPRPEAT